MRYIMILAAAALAICGYAHAQQVNRVCSGTANVALCDLTLQAGKSEADARAAGNIGAR